MSETVDVTLRIHPRNLESLLNEPHPVDRIWLEEEAPDVYALCADVPIGFEASRDLPNRKPGNKVDQLSPERKEALGRAWEALDAPGKAGQ